MAMLLAQQDSLVASARANLIAAWFVVDASGSMAGGRWRLAQEGIRNCLSQLSKIDFVGLITFNDKVKVIDTDIKKDLKSDAFFRMSPGGGTALYDGIAQMVVEATQAHITLTTKSQGSSLGVITYVVVLTDGEDTCSRLSLDETRSLLTKVNALNNFKVILAGINLERKASQALKHLGSAGDRDIEFRELKSNDDIKDLFEHVTVQLALQRQRRLIVADGKSASACTITTTQPIGSSGSGQSSMSISSSSSGTNNRITGSPNSGSIIYQSQGRWEWQGSDGAWHSYDAESNKVLEHKYAKSSPPWTLYIVKKGERVAYQIDFTRMTQTFGTYSRKIRRT